MQAKLASTVALAALLISITAPGCATEKAASSSAPSSNMQGMEEHVEHHESSVSTGEDIEKDAHDRSHMASQAMACTMSECPMHASGVGIAVEDVDGGVALRFSVPSDGADDLQARVEWLALQHNTHHGMTNEQAEQMGHEESGARMPASQADVTERDDGYALIIRPSDPEDLAELRRHIHHHAEMMQQGLCPMMATGHGNPDEDQESAKKDFWEQPVGLWPSLPIGF